MLLNFTTSNLLFRHNYFGHIKLRYYAVPKSYKISIDTHQSMGIFFMLHSYIKQYKEREN